MSAAEKPLTGADTQWPRWEVLKKDSERKPHQAVGSVHAADAVHALLMARTVFARRPAAVSMWVAPAASIHAFTAEELTQVPAHSEAEGGELSRYLVVVKSTNRRSMTFGDLKGEVEASSVRAALDLALELAGEEPVLALWLVEAGSVVRSEPDDADPWFGPAQDKTYKQQSVYSSRATASKDAAEGVPR
ncbi:MAG: phenylacetic acid degradation protein [Trueperaceae bacterium]